MAVLQISKNFCRTAFVLTATVMVAACHVPDGSREPGMTGIVISENSKGKANSETHTIRYYIEKLPDRSYVEIYGDADNPRPWFTAAEALGAMGKPAIPALVAQLATKDQYELKLVLYALMLASQDPALKSDIGNDYLQLDTVLTEDGNPENRQRAVEWWQRHRNLFIDTP